jgi:hypothetical protein
MTKFVFGEKEEQVFLNPDCGKARLSNSASVEYRVCSDRLVKLGIDGYFFGRESLGELIELLEAFRNREDIAE